MCVCVNEAATACLLGASHQSVGAHTQTHTARPPRHAECVFSTGAARGGHHQRSHTATDSFGLCAWQRGSSNGAPKREVQVCVCRVSAKHVWCTCLYYTVDMPVWCGDAVGLHLQKQSTQPSRTVGFVSVCLWERLQYWYRRYRQHPNLRLVLFEFVNQCHRKDITSVHENTGSSVATNINFESPHSLSFRIIVGHNQSIYESWTFRIPK